MRTARFNDHLLTLNSHRADASISGQATGAMSYAFISALKKNPQQSYVQLLNSIRDELEGKYDQKPQLSCSHPLGKNHLLSHANVVLTNVLQIQTCFMLCKYDAVKKISYCGSGLQ